MEPYRESPYPLLVIIGLGTLAGYSVGGVIGALIGLGAVVIFGLATGNAYEVSKIKSWLGQLGGIVMLGLIALMFISALSGPWSCTLNPNQEYRP